MSISKDGDKWKVDVRPEGHAGKRVIRRFRTKAEATRFEAHVIASTIENKPWNPKPPDNRRLSQLIEIWEQEYSPTIGSGGKYARILKASATTSTIRPPASRPRWGLASGARAGPLD